MHIMTAPAVSQILYLLDEAFEGNTWHSLPGNLHRCVTRSTETQNRDLASAECLDVKRVLRHWYGSIHVVDPADQPLDLA